MKREELRKTIEASFPSMEAQTAARINFVDNLLKVNFDGIELHPENPLFCDTVVLFRNPSWNVTTDENGGIIRTPGDMMTVSQFIEMLDKIPQKFDEIKVVEYGCGYKSDDDYLVVKTEEGNCSIFITLEVDDEHFDPVGTSFEEFLCEQNDAVDNAAFALAQALAGYSLEWNQEYIGEIVDSAEAILLECGFHTCHPWYEGEYEVPCYLTNECKNPRCPMKARGLN